MAPKGTARGARRGHLEVDRPLDAPDARPASAVQHAHAVARSQVFRSALHHGDRRAVVQTHEDLLALVLGDAVLDRVAGQPAAARAKDRAHSAARAVPDLTAEDAADRG